MSSTKMIKTVSLLLLFCHAASPATHSLKFFFTGLFGDQTWPEFVGVAMVDEVEVIYCDSITGAEAKQDWMKELMKDDPKHMDWYSDECRASHSFFNTTIQLLMQIFIQTGGVHIFQKMCGCEWDDETDEINGFNQYGYDGEDFITFDFKTQTWITAKPQAVITKHMWDSDTAGLADIVTYLTQHCPERLKRYLNYRRSSLLRTDLPSVSLLQKTPSSPVSCHATGFYPDKAKMFWRKDGKKVNEDVEKGEILPNNDGTFQISVDLDISSVKPEDWRRYDCVFQLSGAKNDIVTKLYKAVIRFNWGRHSLNFFFTGLFGDQTWPEFVGVTVVDGVEVIYCDSNTSRAEPKQDWMKELMKDDPKHMDRYTDECRASHSFFNTTIELVMQLFKQTEGVHSLQGIFGCELEADVVNGFNQYGYDGEDFITFDFKTQTWIAAKPQAVITKHMWDNGTAGLGYNMMYLTQHCPERLKKYLAYGKSSLLRTELPSVSLLQKTPSSPVTCHATGFYPDIAVMFWRKDGKGLHEDVEHGEILPNNDGTFQISVKLDLSSVKPEDWSRYDCVFQLSRVKDDIITKLDKAVIRTNWVTHSLNFFFTGLFGDQTWPDFVGVTTVDKVEVIYCDSNTSRAEPKQDWMKELMIDDPKHMDWYTDGCRASHSFFNTTIQLLMQLFKQTEGVHIFQGMFGCECEDETGEVNGFNQYGYDGEDFITFDFKTQTWITAKPQAVITKHMWDSDTTGLGYNMMYLTQHCCERLKKYLAYGKSSLLRTDLPSVSLLQKTPSSPVSCHATGFYPDKATMFWRKDGKKVNEDVEKGEILPNNDGTFQMRVDLNISSVKPEDWRRYDCVFQLSGVKNKLVTRLDNALNKGRPLPDTRLFPFSAIMLAVIITVFCIWTRKNNRFEPANKDQPPNEDESELF